MLRKLVLAWMFTLVIFVLVGCEGGGTDSITPTVTLAASLEQPEATPTAPIVITPKIEPTPTLSKNQTITLARVFPTPGLPENRLNPSKPISIGAWFFIDITKSMTDYCTFSVLGDQFDPNGDRQSIRSELPKFFTAAIGKMPDRFDGDNSFIGVKVFDSKPEIVKPFERVGEYNNINWEDFREQVNPLKPEDAVSFEDVLESVPITDTLHTRVDPEPFDRKMIVMITDGFMGSSSEYYSPQNTRNEVRQKIINLSNQGVEVFAVLVNCPALLEDRDLKSNYEQDLFYWDALQGGGYANIIKLADYTSPIRAAVESILGEYFDFEFDLDEAYGSVGQGFGRSWLTFSKRPKVDYSGNDGKAIIEVPGKAERVDLWINPTHRVKNIEYGKDGEDIDVLYPDNTLFENTTDPNKKLIPLEGCAPHEIAIDPKPEDNLYPLDVHVSWQVTFPSFEIQEINVFSDDHSIAAGDEGDSKVLNKITNNQNFFVEVSVAQWDSVSETYGELVEGFSDCYDISVVIDLPNGEIFQEIIDLDNISRTDTISVLSGITPTISQEPLVITAHIIPEYENNGKSPISVSHFGEPLTLDLNYVPFMDASQLDCKEANDCHSLIELSFIEDLNDQNDQSYIQSYLLTSKDDFDCSANGEGINSPNSELTVEGGEQEWFARNIEDFASDSNSSPSLSVLPNSNVYLLNFPDMKLYFEQKDEDKTCNYEAVLLQWTEPNTGTDNLLCRITIPDDIYDEMSEQNDPRSIEIDSDMNPTIDCKSTGIRVKS